MRKYFPALPRPRSAKDEISIKRGNFQLIWIELFCWWKLALWRNLVGIISPPRRDNFSHMNSPFKIAHLIKGYLLRQRCFYVSQNMYDHASHHVIDSIRRFHSVCFYKSFSISTKFWHPKIYFELTTLLNLVDNVTG